MRKILSRYALPVLLPLVVVGCNVVGALLHGDIQGAVMYGSEAVYEGGKKIKAKKAENEDQVNISQEYYIGRGVSANVFKKYKRVDDVNLNKYVRLVGDNLAKASRGAEQPNAKQPYKGYFFAIIDTPKVNAFSAPGGFIFITRGALQAMKTEDELACVLGHEIAHVTGRHGIKFVIKERNRAIPFEAASEVVAERSPALIGDMAKQLGGMCGDLFNKAFNGFGKEFELEADKYGTIYASRAGYNPKAMTEFLKRTHHGEDIEE